LPISIKAETTPCHSCASSSHNRISKTYVQGLRLEPLEDGITWDTIEKEADFELIATLLSQELHPAILASCKLPSSLAFGISIETPAEQQEIIAQWLLLNLPSVEMLKISISREWSFKLLKSCHEV